MQALFGLSNKTDTKDEKKAGVERGGAQESSAYCYTRLSKGSIRLLKLLPGGTDEPLRGSLIATPLRGSTNFQLEREEDSERPSKLESEDDDTSSLESWAASESDSDREGFKLPFFSNRAPKFTAISYRWGPPVFDHRIELDGGFLNITESAAGALRRFRDRKHSSRIWIDSICINQDDRIEKEAQVSMMGDIYENASKVLVWLGDATPTDCYAFWSMAVLGPSGSSKGEDKAVDWPDMKDMVEDCGNQTSDVMVSRMAPDKCPFCSGSMRVPSAPLPGQPEPGILTRAFQLFQSEKQYTMWDSVAMLLQKPYFFRLWPFQEVLLPGQERIWYFAGQHYVKGPDLHKFAGHYLETLGSVDLTHDVSYKRFQQLIQGNDDRKEHELIEVLLNTASMESSNALDRVFAVRALMRPDDARYLAPNYGLQANDLWTRVVQRYIKSSAPDSLLLALAGYQRCMSPIDSLDLPSWIPDFNRLSSGPCLGKLAAHKAATDHTFKIQTSDDNTISTKSKCYGTVEQQFKGNERLLTYPNNFTRFVGEHDRHKANLPPPDLRSKLVLTQMLLPWFSWCYHHINSTLSHHSKTLDFDKLGAFLRQGHPATQSMRDDKPYTRDDGYTRPMDDQIQVEVAAGYFSVGQFFGLNSSRRPKITCSLDPVKTLPMPWEPKASFIDDRRVLCSLRDGRMGWLPETARAGDEVWLLQGCSIPFILRKRDDGSFENLGDAYVEGVGQYESICKQNGTGVDDKQEVVQILIR